VREIYVSCVGDPVHAGDKALTLETPAQRGRVNRYAIKAVFILACMILTVLVVRGTDYISSCKSNYHTITTTVAPVIYVC
jgi:hypothetical protein